MGRSNLETRYCRRNSPIFVLSSLSRVYLAGFKEAIFIQENNRMISSSFKLLPALMQFDGISGEWAAG